MGIPTTCLWLDRHPSDIYFWKAVCAPNRAPETKSFAPTDWTKGTFRRDRGQMFFWAAASMFDRNLDPRLPTTIILIG